MPRETYTKWGVALVVSGPSGAGKSTVCRGLRAQWPDLHFSVSCTTRTPRPGETNGVEYTFLSPDEFRTRIAQGAFLEHAEVHGNYYGTPRSEVEPFVEAGADVLLDIDVQGARQVRESVQRNGLADRVLFAFLAPPSLAELETRLRGRGTESEDVIQRRLANARREMDAWGEYDYLVVNDEVELAVARLLAILTAGHCAVRNVEWQP